MRHSTPGRAEIRIAARRWLALLAVAFLGSPAGAPLRAEAVSSGAVSTITVQASELIPRDERDRSLHGSLWQAGFRLGLLFQHGVEPGIGLSYGRAGGECPEPSEILTLDLSLRVHLTPNGPTDLFVGGGYRNLTRRLDFRCGWSGGYCPMYDWGWGYEAVAGFGLPLGRRDLLLGVEGAYTSDQSAVLGHGDSGSCRSMALTGASVRIYLTYRLPHPGRNASRSSEPL